jgi:hypothetical protein
MPSDIQPSLDRIIDLIQRPFWTQIGFWISIIVSALGVYFSIRAFIEARQAKRAATAAGRTVKLQTTAIELTEIAQKLDRMQPDIRFDEARDILSETSRRLLRAISPFASEPALSKAIGTLRQALDAAHSSLKSVRPSDPAKESEVPNVVYYAIEDDFAMLNNCVAELLGLFEKQSFDFGDKNAKS